MSIPHAVPRGAADFGAGAFALRIGGREVRADRNDELLAAVIGEEYIEESDPELLFLMRLEHAIIIATAVQESIVAAAVARTRTWTSPPTRAPGPSCSRDGRVPIPVCGGRTRCRSCS